MEYKFGDKQQEFIDWLCNIKPARWPFGREDATVKIKVLGFEDNNKQYEIPKTQTNTNDPLATSKTKSP